MRIFNRTWFTLTTIAIASHGFCSASSAPAADDTALIRALLDHQAADWNRGDLDGFLSGYWRSPKVVFQSGGDRLEGFEAVRKRYFARYRDEGKAMGQLTFSQLEVEALGPDAAFARGAWKLVMPDGSTPHGLFTLVLRKMPEGWRIVHDHTSSA